jgi:predicted nuclease with TOPRIM domain
VKGISQEMTLFRAKEAVADIKAAREAKPKKLNPLQAMAADNKTLRDENARLRAKVNGIESRVTSLEAFQAAQESFNAGTKDRVGQLQRSSAAGDMLCPGCGQPTGVGAHGVTCFTTVS